MTKDIAFSTLLLILISCSSKIETDKNINKKPEEDSFQELVNTDKGIYPVQIIFHGIGLNDIQGEPLSILINSDSVWVSMKNKLDTFKVATGINDTEFAKILKDFSKEDFEKDKHYIHPHVRDGGTTLIKTKYGEKKFTNVFGWKDFEHITPDTIGMMKFESLVKYAGRYTNEIRK